MIILEPVVRRPRSRSQANNSTGRSEFGPNVTDSDEHSEHSASVRQALSIAQGESLQSAVPCEPDSPVPTSNRNSQRVIMQQGPHGPADKAIRIQVDLLRGGCLPGSEATVRVTVNHVRPVRSLHGIIVTLHRMSHIDREPSTPIKASDRTKLGLDAVPKSRTGLGGLLFTSEDPNMTFRANLAQNTTHLIVDPETLSATVTQSVRVPEEVFPTITNVPGNLLVFKYYVEVIVDVQAKLASQNSYFNWYVQANGSFDAPKNSVAFDYQRTSVFRRETHVVACDMPLIIGTKDTTPKLSKQPAVTSANRLTTVNLESLRFQEGEPDYEEAHTYRVQENLKATQPSILPPTSPLDESSQQSIRQETTDSRFQSSPPAGEALLDEKIRLHRAAELLLPSTPPLEGDNGDAGPSTLRSLQPSAPTELQIRGNHNELGPSSMTEATAITTLPMVQLQQTINADSCETSTTNSIRDDKQEMERQRFMAMTSAPELDSDEEAERRVHEPSAPILDDNGGNQTYYNHLDQIENLPLYHK